jgi:hypothetical protein
MFGDTYMSLSRAETLQNFRQIEHSLVQVQACGEPRIELQAFLSSCQDQDGDIFD